MFPIHYPKFRALDANGNPLAGGKLWTYEAGTTTPKATYGDPDGASPNTNPVVLDANGEAYVFGSGAYKLALQDANGVALWTADDVTDPEEPFASWQASLGALGLRPALPNLGLSDPFGLDPATTSGLVYGYKGGVVLAADTQTPVAIVAGTVTLAASATNYVQRTSAGIVLANTTGWTVGSVPMALVVTGSAGIQSVVDYRIAPVPLVAQVVSREMVAYYEGTLATTDKQPVIRMPATRWLKALRYYRDNTTAPVGVCAVALLKNGSSVATASILDTDPNKTWKATDLSQHEGVVDGNGKPILRFDAGDTVGWQVVSVGSTPPTNITVVADFTEAPR